MRIIVCHDVLTPDGMDERRLEPIRELTQIVAAAFAAVRLRFEDILRDCQVGNAAARISFGNRLMNNARGLRRRGNRLRILWLNS